MCRITIRFQPFEWSLAIYNFIDYCSIVVVYLDPKGPNSHALNPHKAELLSYIGDLGREFIAAEPSIDFEMNSRLHSGRLENRV